MGYWWLLIIALAWAPIAIMFIACRVPKEEQEGMTLEQFFSVLALATLWKNRQL